MAGLTFLAHPEGNGMSEKAGSHTVGPPGTTILAEAVVYEAMRLRQELLFVRALYDHQTRWSGIVAQEEAVCPVHTGQSPSLMPAAVLPFGPLRSSRVNESHFSSDRPLTWAGSGVEYYELAPGWSVCVNESMKRGERRPPAVKTTGTEHQASVEGSPSPQTPHPLAADAPSRGIKFPISSVRIRTVRS